mmetsp:Transcript_8944/g.18613  ORF Transcript_8944/g.18613 Transcript_8944/m.18613 type:complete len:299 (-) Transcript_8944:3459-4355(-)
MEEHGDVGDSCQRCMYCFEIETNVANIVNLGCLCKGTMGMIHVHCKAKFAQLKTTATSDLRSREWVWTHCEVCSSNLTNVDGLMTLARERLRLSTITYNSEIETTITGERELVECMAVSFLATIIIKKCKNHDGTDKFWEEGLDLLHSTIAKFRALPKGPYKTGVIWALEMKFVDCLYFVQCRLFEQSANMKDNLLIYFDAIETARNYGIRFKDLFVSLLQMKKFFVDLPFKSVIDSKRNENGELVLTEQESKCLRAIKKRILVAMGDAASNGGGILSRCVAEQLNLQVELVNMSTSH